MVTYGTKHVVLKQSDDIYNDILLPLKERSRHSDKRCVYFYRIIGFNNQTEFIDKTALLHQKLINLGDLYLYFIENIPIPYNEYLNNKINETFASLVEDSFFNNGTHEDRLANGRSLNTSEYGLQADILCDIIEKAKLFPVIVAEIKAAFKIVLKEYIKKETSVNIGKVKNFISKLLLWMHEYIPELYKVKSPWNPKILYYGDIKKHAAFFLILLSQIGCDVLYINPHSDLGYQKADNSNRFSMLREERIKIKLKSPPIKAGGKPKQPVNMEQLYQVVPTMGCSAVVKLKNTNNILQDIMVPLNKRSGYLGHPAPVWPVYFYRYIGVSGTMDTEVDEYYNRLYQMDKDLRSRRNGYIRITNQLTVPENNEIAFYKDKLGRAKVLLLYGSEKDFLINKVINAQILPTTINQPLNNTINTAFKDIIYLFDELEPNNNISKLENFALKMIGWINKYFKSLYKVSDFKDSPKIVYYGDIKSHEVYLLIYFSKIGCDVLYINSDIKEDDVFKQIDPREEYTKLAQNELSKESEQFPENERKVRKATVAYNASQEIEQVIYSDDVGLFKPWQFENSMTKPITLRTTYDELKILWPEEARVRPEFKVVNNTVYVPNLFAKIKGTHKELGRYWHDVSDLSASKNTHVITSVPFTKISYSKRDLYASAFLFNNSGLIDRERLYKSDFYKYGYLRNSLQEFIINKVEELIKADIFINNDKELHLKVLMTILNMDENILNLLEVFDYPGYIPKMVIYDAAKDIFSDEDAIIIAFLNLVGIDIAIFTPTNYNNIELKLKENLLDIHQLPSVQFDLEVPDLNIKPNDESKFSVFLNNVSQRIRRKFH
ncbi:YceG family protein [Desulfoscipio gibsoniae]